MRRTVSFRFRELVAEIKYCKRGVMEINRCMLTCTDIPYETDDYEYFAREEFARNSAFNGYVFLGIVRVVSDEIRSFSMERRTVVRMFPDNTRIREILFKGDKHEEENA